MTKKKSYSQGYNAAFTMIVAAMIARYDPSGVHSEMQIIYSVGVWYVKVWDSKRNMISSANENLMEAIEEIFREQLKRERIILLFCLLTK